MTWRRYLLAPLLFSLVMPSVTLAEEPPDDGIVILEWSVRQEIEELIHDLRSERGDLSQRLDLIANLLKLHGDRPFAHNNRYLPVSQVLSEVMTELGILNAFRSQFNTIAERNLVEAERSADPTLIRDVAQQFPGTDAALKAWRRLADRAWDRGQLGLYAALAIRSQEQSDPDRLQRFNAAAALLLPADTTVIPSDLESINQMWGITIPSFQQRPPQNRPQNQRSIQPFHRQNQNNSLLGPAVNFSQPGPGGVVAISNGFEVGVIDPLIGTLTGPLVKIGNQRSNHVPIFDQDGNVISLGLSSQFELVVTASTHEGSVNWSSNLRIGNARSNRTSSPVIIDGIIGIAVNENQRDGSQLTLIGLQAADGSEIFRIPIAKDSTAVGRQFNGGSRGGGPISPMLVSHRGTFAIANDNGILAQVAPNGDLVALWAARTNNAPFQQRNFGASSREPTRSAQLFSDGNYIILSDRFGSGLTIVTSNAQTGELKAQRYTGNASGDELVAMRNGKALLAGRRISLLNLATNTIEWSTQAQSQPGATLGTIGSDRALVIRNNTVSLYDLANGEALSQIYFPQNNSIAVVNDVLVTEQQGSFIGYGDGNLFRQRLKSAIAQNPSDFRPHIALYGLARATNSKADAMSHMLEALQRGAPARYAEEAASMLRPRIRPRLNTDAALEDIALFRQLGRYEPALNTEATYWQARHLESTQDHVQAIETYQALLSEQTSLIRLTPQIKADLHALVQAGLGRLGVSDLPSWLHPEPQVGAEEQVINGTAWKISGQALTAPIFSDNSLFAYRNGDIHAHDLSDGSLIWRREIQEDDQAMLGLRFRPNDTTISVDVIPGSAAQKAGVQDGDSVTAFEGKPVNNTNELIDLISAKNAGDPFALTLTRQENDRLTTKEITGNLGVYLMSPVRANQHWVVAQRMYLQYRDGKQFIVADSQPAELRLLSRATGKELWKRVLPLTISGHNPPKPLLTNSHLIIEFEGDLIAFDIRPSLSGEPISQNPAWTLKGRGSALNSPELLGKGFLVLADEQAELLRLLQLSSGRILFEIPAVPGDTKLHLSQGDLIIEQTGKGLSVWDLGKGLKRWQLSGNSVRAVSFNQDTVFAINQEQRLVMLERANGQQRRVLNDFPLVESVSVHESTGYIHGRKENGQQFIAAIGLQSGTTKWQRSIPVGAEVRDVPTAHSGGVTIELVSRGYPPSLMTLNLDGKLQGIGDPEEGEMISLPQGSIISNQDGIQMITSILPEKSPPITALEIDGEKFSKEVINDSWDKLAWEGVNGARYAIASQEGHIALIFDLAHDAKQLTARIGNSGPELDPFGQKLSIIRNRVPSLKSHNEGWQMKSYQRLANGPEGSWRGVVVLTPPILMDPLRQPEIFISSNLEQKSGAWWLRRLWRPIESIASQP